MTHFCNAARFRGNSPYFRLARIWRTGSLRHAHSHARTLTCFAFFATDFRGKERLLAV